MVTPKYDNWCPVAKSPCKSGYILFSDIQLLCELEYINPDNISDSKIARCKFWDNNACTLKGV